MKSAILSLTSAVAVLALSSCGLEKVATGPEPTKFLKSTGVDMAERSPRLPFEHSWFDPKTDFSKYKHIVVRPVTTAYLRSEKWEESKSPSIRTKRAYLRRCNALARYWDKSLNKAFSSPLCMYYKASDASQPGTLVLEVALTEVRFARPAAKDAPAPPTSDSVLGAVAGPPTCGFESRARDAATGKVVATAADHRGPEIKVIPNEKKQPLAKPNEDICDEWSKQLMERSNAEIYPTVRRKWLSIF